MFIWSVPTLWTCGRGTVLLNIALPIKVNCFYHERLYQLWLNLLWSLPGGNKFYPLIYKIEAHHIVLIMYSETITMTLGVQLLSTQLLGQPSSVNKLQHGRLNDISCFLQNVPGVVESLKIITAEKSTRIAKYAFDYAQQKRRKKVTAIHKANIM